MRSIVIATHNPGKIIEIKELLKNYNFIIYSSNDFKIKDFVFLPSFSVEFLND